MITRLADKKPLHILFFVWAAMQGLLLITFGIVTTGEATKYTDEANNLLQLGRFSEPKYIFYSAYILVHIVFIKLGFETIGVYLFQLLTNFIAMFFLFKTTYTLTKKKVIAFISVLLLLLCYSWQYWTVYLYTESFFCNLLIIFTYLLFGTKAKTNGRTVAAVIVFFIIVAARPTGMFLIPVVCSVMIYKLWKEKRKVYAVIAFLSMSLIFFSVLNFAMKGGSSYDFMKPFLENNVLCYIPEEPRANNIVLTSSANSLQSIWVYIIQNPLQFLKLSGLKFCSYWGMTRYYYSPFHNVWLMCFFYPLYLFAAAGLWRLRKSQPYFVVFVTVLFLIFTLSIIFTCDDWNNRFNMPIIPFIILLAGVGIYHVFQKRSA